MFVLHRKYIGAAWGVLSCCCKCAPPASPLPPVLFQVQQLLPCLYFQGFFKEKKFSTRDDCFIEIRHRTVLLKQGGERRQPRSVPFYLNSYQRTLASYTWANDRLRTLHGKRCTHSLTKGGNESSAASCVGSANTKYGIPVWSGILADTLQWQLPGQRIHG